MELRIWYFLCFCEDGVDFCFSNEVEVDVCVVWMIQQIDVSCVVKDWCIFELDVMQKQFCWCFGIYFLDVGWQECFGVCVVCCLSFFDFEICIWVMEEDVDWSGYVVVEKYVCSDVVGMFEVNGEFF